MADFIASVHFFRATAKLHNTAGAVGNHGGGAGFFEVGCFALENPLGDGGEFNGVATAKPATTIIFFGFDIVADKVNEVFGFLGNPKATAEVTGSMVGYIFSAFNKVFLFQAENVFAKRTEVYDFAREPLGGCFHGAVSEGVRVSVSQVRGARGAQGDDIVIGGGVAGLDVLFRNVPRNVLFAHHGDGQSATGLVHGEVNANVVGFKYLEGGLKLFRINEVLGTPCEKSDFYFGVGWLNGF